MSFLKAYQYINTRSDIPTNLFIMSSEHKVQFVLIDLQLFKYLYAPKRPLVKEIPPIKPLSGKIYSLISGFKMKTDYI